MDRARVPLPKVQFGCGKGPAQPACICQSSRPMPEGCEEQANEKQRKKDRKKRTGYGPRSGGLGCVSVPRAELCDVPGPSPGPRQAGLSPHVRPDLSPASSGGSISPSLRGEGPPSTGGGGGRASRAQGAVPWPHRGVRLCSRGPFARWATAERFGETRLSSPAACRCRRLGDVATTSRAPRGGKPRAVWAYAAAGGPGRSFGSRVLSFPGLHFCGWTGHPGAHAAGLRRTADEPTPSIAVCFTPTLRKTTSFPGEENAHSRETKL